MLEKLIEPRSQGETPAGAVHRYRLSRPDRRGRLDRAGRARTCPETGRARISTCRTRFATAFPRIGDHETAILIHNDAVVQGLSEVPFMTDVQHWGVLTIGTGLGNARFTNRQVEKIEPRTRLEVNAHGISHITQSSDSLHLQATCVRFAMPFSASSPMRSAPVPRPPPGRTGSWPPRSRCATGSSTSGCVRRGTLRTQQRKKRVYYLSIEFLIGGPVRHAGQSRPAADGPRRAGSARRRSRRAAQARARSGARQRRPRPARRLLSWTAWRRWRCRPTATASATSTACSSSRSSDGWQHEVPEDWLAFGNPWEFERPEIDLSDRLRRHASNMSAATPTPRAALWYPAETRAGRRLRHAGRRLARPPRQHAAAVVGARRRTPIHLAAFNQGDYVGATGGARAGRGDLARALSERRHARRPGAAAAAGVLLHLGVAAGHRAPPSVRSSTTWSRCRTTPRSSSTTRIRRSRSPS